MMRRRMHVGPAGRLALVALLAAACGDNPSAPEAPLGGAPRAARSFLTAEQAQDVVASGRFLPARVSDQQAFNAIKGQLSGFYSEVDFVYEAPEPTPNVYAYEADGRKIVHVTGGLMRLEGFGYEGVLMAMAHGVGVFRGGEPKTSLGQAGVGAADYFAFGEIPNTAWYGSRGREYLAEAFRQWTYVFGLVSEQHAAGNLADTLLNPPLACRIATIQSAPDFHPLPACAGGI